MRDADYVIGSIQARLLRIEPAGNGSYVHYRLPSGDIEELSLIQPGVTVQVGWGSPGSVAEYDEWQAKNPIKTPPTRSR